MEDRDEKISDAQATEQTTPEVQSIKDMEDQDSEKHPGSGTAPQGTEHQYISGIKLWTLLGSLTLVCFLMMLDMSIIVTVSWVVMVLSTNPLLTLLLGYSTDHERLPFSNRRGMVRKCISHIKVSNTPHTPSLDKYSLSSVAPSSP